MTNKWLVAYDCKTYSVYLLHHTDVESTTTYEQALAWAKGCIQVAGYYDSVFMVLQLPNGMASDLHDVFPETGDDDVDLVAVIPVQGSGGPMPSPERHAKWLAWSKEHLAVGDSLGITYCVTNLNDYGEADDVSPWLIAVMDQYKVIA
jgi:hypothetical protein